MALRELRNQESLGLSSPSYADLKSRSQQVIRDSSVSRDVDSYGLRSLLARMLRLSCSSRMTYMRVLEDRSWPRGEDVGVIQS